jgi:molybdenum cofactor cytidylyltransferase
MNNAADASGTTTSLKIGAILLAAGTSSRLGEPKQLLLYNDRPLIARAAEAILAAGLSSVVVVLGAHAEKIRPAIASLPMIIEENSTWAEGMGSSIRTGITALESNAPVLDAVLIALCDQPHFSEISINTLRTALTGPITIAATRHGEGAGVPAIFRREHFPALRALTGAEGARGIISAHLANVARVDLPELAIDIDTPADWSRLKSI